MVAPPWLVPEAAPPPHSLGKDSTVLHNTRRPTDMPCAAGGRCKVRRTVRQPPGIITLDIHFGCAGDICTGFAGSRVHELSLTSDPPGSGLVVWGDIRPPWNNADTAKPWLAVGDGEEETIRRDLQRRYSWKWPFSDRRARTTTTIAESVTTRWMSRQPPKKTRRRRAPMLPTHAAKPMWL